MLGLSTSGRHLVPLEGSIAAVVAGVLLIAAYIRHARRTVAPLVDLSLLAIPTFRDGLVGGLLFRVGVGAIPFLLPLMLQVGFGLNALQSGLLTFASAAGAMIMKGMARRILKAAGFRTVLTWNALVASAFIATNGFFTPATPVWLILGLLLVGGCFRSLEFTSLNTIVYADVPTPRMSAATSLVGVAQQLSLGIGIALGAFVLEAVSRARSETDLTAGDFGPAFVTVALVSAASSVFFRRLDPDAGAEMAGRALIKARPAADSV